MPKTPCSASKRFLDTIEDAKCSVERWFASQGLNSNNSSSGYRAFVIDTQSNTVVTTVNIAPKPLLNWSDEAPAPTPDQPTTATE